MSSAKRNLVAILGAAVLLLSLGLYLDTRSEYDEPTREPHGLFKTLRIHTDDAGVATLYALTDLGELWVSEDGGYTWKCRSNVKQSAIRVRR